MSALRRTTYNLSRSYLHPTASQVYPKTLYDPYNEKDSCGVGFVAGLSGEPQRRIVANAIEMLERMHHRGGCGCEPNSGDGAGMMSGIPDTFFRNEVASQVGEENFALPEFGQYAVGQIFVPKRKQNSKLANCAAHPYLLKPSLVTFASGEQGIEVL